MNYRQKYLKYKTQYLELNGGTALPTINWSNKEVVLAAVTHNGFAIRFASEELKVDIEVVMAAVTQNGFALRYVSEELKADIEVVMASITNNGSALRFASEALQGDKEVVLASITNDGYALRFASKALQGDKEVVFAAVTNNGSAIKFASEALQGDKEVVLTAVTQNGDALQFASETLQGDKEVVLAAVTQNGSTIEFASTELQGDKSLVLAAVTQNGFTLRYASEELQADIEVVLTALINDYLGINIGSILQYASTKLQFQLTGKSKEEIHILYHRWQERIEKERRREVIESMKMQLEQISKINQEGDRNPEFQALERHIKLYKKIPEEFKCPITTEIMENPVVTADGHTYERLGIETWLRNHNTSPLTGDILADKILTPNHALRNTIQTWLEGYSEDTQGGVFDF